MKVQKLPQFIVNQIAAGEVIDRPSAVVKELVENSIDSGADSITINLRNAGKSYISVQDNGSGIEKDDLKIVTEMHTTSKLPALDLTQIDFLGFRGEALASISSISRMMIDSNCNQESWVAEYNGSDFVSMKPSSIQSGTLIEVRDLFFAIPARLNFLKTDKTELLNIVSLLKKISIPYQNISFKLISDSKEVLNYKKTNLKGRISDVIGKDVTADLIYIDDFTENHISVSGCISKPTTNVKTSESIYTYVNGRYIKDKFLSFVVKNAYSDLIPKDRYPIAILFINIDNSLIDVNVHPRKLEIRFRNQNDIKYVIERVVREVLGKYSSNFSKSTVSNFINNYKTNNVSKLDYKPYVSKRDIYNKDIYNEYITSDLNRAKNVTNFIENNLVLSDSPAKFLDDELPDFVNGELFSDKPADAEAVKKIDLGNALYQIDNKYIIAAKDDTFTIIDQHAVHERLTFERLKNSYKQNDLIAQKLMIPIEVNFSDYDSEQLLRFRDDLAKSGFIIEKFSNGIRVLSVPQVIIGADIDGILKDLLSDIMEFDDIITVDKKINTFFATFACHTSIRAGQKLSIDEMNQIIRDIEDNENMAQCNHGRPSYITMSTKDIDKIFNR